MSDAKTPSDLSMDEILSTIRRLIADDEVVARAPSPGPQAVAVPAGEPAPEAEAVLELTEVLDDEGAERAPFDSPGSPVVELVSPLAAAPKPEPLRAAPGSRLEPEPIKSVEQSVIAEASVFAASLRGGATVRREPHLDSTPPLDSRKLEEIVAEMLRPLLRTWLDDNLPLLVERLVQAEIARVVREPGSI
jgi:hypothetical protein